jgi:hypothetical protein
MDSFLRYWLAWPSAERLMSQPWGWPLCETMHFFGIILLIGGVGIFDLRMLGIAKDLPISKLRQLLPWGVFGFALCVVSGSLFVLGFRANLPTPSYDVIMTDRWLQLKLIFLALAGLNLAAFYLTGMSRAVDKLGPGDDAPLAAKFIAATSLFLWLGVLYFGRLIPEGLTY